MTSTIEKRPITTVDAVIFTVADGKLMVAVQARTQEPFKGDLALVGGYIFVDDDSSTDDTVARNLAKKAGLDGVFIEQLQTFSGPDRDPRGWSITVAYFALVPLAVLQRSVSEHRLELIPADELKNHKLAFDHAHIIQAAIDRVRGKGAYSVLPARMLPEKFVLSQLEEIYEAVVGKKDSASFRRKILSLDVIEPTDETFNSATSRRPAVVYRLKPNAGVFDRRV